MTLRIQGLIGRTERPKRCHNMNEEGDAHSIRLTEEKTGSEWKGKTCSSDSSSRVFGHRNDAQRASDREGRIRKKPPSNLATDRRPIKPTWREIWRIGLGVWRVTDRSILKKWQICRNSGQHDIVRGMREF